MAEYHRKRRAGEPAVWPIARKRPPIDSSELQRRHHYKKKYGITTDWYDEKLTDQGGGCAICGKDTPTEGHSFLCVDHDHATGKPRGLLCTRCNHAIERLESIPEWDAKAMAYLEKYGKLQQ